MRLVMGLWSSKLVALVSVGFFGILAPIWTNAQLAPVAGGHYAKDSGTGFQGAANSSGGFSSTVPMDLPAARGGLSVPVQVSYGGKRVGAAGLGWDVPLTFISRNNTTAYRRPAPQVAGQTAPFVAAEQYSLTMDGASIDLVRNTSNTAWVARRGSSQIEVRSGAEGTMLMYDGKGRTYSFSSQSPLAGGRLVDGNLYLLKSITGSGGNRVELSYGITAPALSGGVTGVAINLTSVSYNLNPSVANCFKHKVFLTYDAPVASPALPLSMSMENGTVMARVQKLSAIVVKSKETCSTSEKTLSTYNFTYQNDADTKQPQLLSVTMTGRQGTAEQYVTLPIATYSYGSIVDTATNQITYAKTLSAGPPSSSVNGLSYTSAKRVKDSLNRFDGTHLETQQALMDFNGDGRLDFSDSSRKIYLNSSGPGGPIQFTATDKSVPVVQTNRSEHFGVVYDVSKDGRSRSSTVNDIYTKYIDMNGDGRIDTVDVGDSPENPDVDHSFWTVRLNVPVPGDPSKSNFVVRKIPTAQIRAALLERGFSFAGAVPLGRTTTVPETLIAYCWSNRYQNDAWFWSPDPSGAECTGVPAPSPRKKTITEFELKDVNGDGYPDFVFNGSYVNVEIRNPPPPPAYPAPPGQTVYVLTTLPSEISGSRNILALINTAGVHFNETEELFSSPITLEVGGTTGCGIGRWVVDTTSAESGGKMAEICGLQDINGDGIADRITTENNVTFAKLGTGDMSRPYASAGITLPGPLARTETDLRTFVEYPGLAVPNECYTKTTSDTTSWAGLRDINGDGIPDYVTASLGGSVAMGTGTGFASPISIVSPFGAALPLMVERNQCNASPTPTEPTVLTSSTPSGFYDLDGDGQLEMVAMTADKWDIFHLVSPVTQIDVGTGILSVPAAGRLMKIDNGYGASTTIGYRSAKEEWNTAHNVPFPEIVVASVGKKDTSGASLMSTTQYAYRGAQMIFDAAYDKFIFPGYLRTVTLQNNGDALSPGSGIATITDNNGLAIFDAANMTAAQRFERYLKAGLTGTVTTLSGNVGTNPWNLLAVDINADTRRTAAVQYGWEARLLPAGTAGTGNEQCVDMVFPYDYLASKNARQSTLEDACTQHGFIFQKLAFSWRGMPGSENALTSLATVQMSSTVEEIDDFQRITRIRDDGDLHNDETYDNVDNTCTQTVFATPTGTNERVLNAPVSRITTDCESLTVSESRWEYDTSSTGVKLPAGQVSKGFVTAQIESRLNATTGDPIMDANGSSKIRVFDITYDDNGNPTKVSKTRDDGASLVVNNTFDPYGLVLQSSISDATNANGTKLPAQTSNVTFDPVSMNLVSTTDATGMVNSYTYDGFNRVLLSKVKPVGGTEGVLSSVTYNGFAADQTSGRNIVQKVFTNPVPVANVGTAAGRVGTVFLDSLGRSHSTEVALGEDYANKKMIIGKRTYDQLGRVKFEADPFPSTDNFSTAYGTTYYFNPDETPLASIRGYGEMPWTMITEEATETYPSNFDHRFQNHTEILDVRRPDSLSTGPQFGVVYKTRLSAQGRVLERWTSKLALLSERAFFSYDLLGQLRSMARFKDDGPQDSSVSTAWTNDSLGRVIKLEEAGAATQNRSYSSWGELTISQWNDAVLGDRRSVMQYDALGRLTRSEDSTDNVVDAATVNTYLYDTGVNTPVPAVTATNVLGRLAKATSPTSTVAFSYDGLGRINAQTFTDTSVSPAKVYVQKHETNGDGSPKNLSLLLPDNGFKLEKVDYGYDSAGRTRTIKYNDGTNRDLFNAVGSAGMDVFGRIRQAKYGVNTFTADYAEVGRRLLNSVKVESPAGKSRGIAFPSIVGEPLAFDPVGRERVRRESKDGVVSPFDSKSVYDSLGRLQLASLPYKTGSGSALQDERFYTYDALGNVVQQTTLDPTSPVANNVSLSYSTIDRDRICSVVYSTATPPTACNVKYDGVGNIIEMPTRESGIRTLTYYANGSTKSIASGATVANYKYDAFGDVQQLTLDSTTSTDTRRDKHFGGMLTQRTENGASVLNRKIAGPGLSASRHGPAGEWTFTFGEQRGNRFVTDQSGAFVQDMAYKPFGEKDTTLSGGVLPGSTKYNNAQWNGEDALAALGISQLGARMYDPVIGRFLSRDPLILTRTGATSNPYAFADNDPVNSSDPTGLMSRQPKPGDDFGDVKCEGDCATRGNKGLPSPDRPGKTLPNTKGPVTLPPGPNPPPPPASNGRDYSGGVPTPSANPSSGNGGAGRGDHGGGTLLSWEMDYGYDGRSGNDRLKDAADNSDSVRNALKTAGRMILKLWADGIKEEVQEGVDEFESCGNGNLIDCYLSGENLKSGASDQSGDYDQGPVLNLIDDVLRLRKTGKYKHSGGKFKPGSNARGQRRSKYNDLRQHNDDIEGAREDQMGNKRIGPDGKVYWEPHPHDSADKHQKKF